MEAQSNYDPCFLKEFFKVVSFLRDDGFKYAFVWSCDELHVTNKGNLIN